VRLTDFWWRMEEHFGPAYAHSVARDQIISRLGHRCVIDALAEGEDPKRVWLAVCEHFEVPVGQRH
jgi:hypothetical protein